MTKLDDLGKKHGTDKSSLHHGYLDFYGDLFYDLRTEPVVFLEIGVAGGNSIRMWEEWFSHPEARIYGVDIEDRPLDPFDKRTSIIIGDASSPNFIYDLTNRTGPLSIITDDGSHMSGQQKDTLRLLWPHLKSGGWFITEDLHCSYKEPWTSPKEVSFIAHLMDWINDCMERGEGDCGAPSRSQVHELIIRKSIVAIRKR
jgi:hypothetical protein